MYKFKELCEGLKDKYNPKEKTDVLVFLRQFGHKLALRGQDPIAYLYYNGEPANVLSESHRFSPRAL